MKDTILAAAMATHIPEAEAGLWYVKRFRLAKDIRVPRTPDGLPGRKVWVDLPAGTYTQLFRWTNATLHKLGELVMQDTPDELDTHLNFMLNARGHVLISGLGLGCCVRGCLANPNVEHVTCIERDPNVLRLVRSNLFPADGRDELESRFTLQIADAREWSKRADIGRFDCAWHDLWNDEDNGDPALAVMHTELLVNLAERVDRQGAWAFPRQLKPQWKRLLHLY